MQLRHLGILRRPNGHFRSWWNVPPAKILVSFSNPSETRKANVHQLFGYSGGTELAPSSTQTMASSVLSVVQQLMRLCLHLSASPLEAWSAAGALAK